MGNKVDSEVKVVYVTDMGGEYKLCTGIADIYEGGVMVIGTEESDLYVTRQAGEWLNYLEFKKASSTLYKRAVALAKQKVGIKQ